MPQVEYVSLPVADWLQGFTVTSIDGRPESWDDARTQVHIGFNKRSGLRNHPDADNHLLQLKFKFAATAERYLSDIDAFCQNHGVPDELKRLHFLKLGADIYDRMYGGSGLVAPKIEIASTLSPFAPDFEDRIVQAAKNAPRALREVVTLMNTSTRLVGRYRDYKPEAKRKGDGIAGMFRHFYNDVLIMQQARPLMDGERRMMLLPYFERTLMHEWAHVFDTSKISASRAFKTIVASGIQSLHLLPSKRIKDCFSREATQDFRLASTGETTTVVYKFGNDETSAGHRHNIRYYLPRSERGLHADMDTVQEEVFAQSVALNLYNSRVQSFARTYAPAMAEASRILRLADDILSLPLDASAFLRPAVRKQDKAIVRQATERWNCVFPRLTT